MRLRSGFRGVPVALAVLFSSCAGGPAGKDPVSRVPMVKGDDVTSATTPGDANHRELVRIRGVKLGNLFQLLEEDSVLLVDVRPAFFFRLGHIPGAVSLPLKNFEAGLKSFRQDLDEALTSGRKVVIYCADEDCPDSLTTARKLARMGYSTSVYRGGWKEWRSAGL